MKRKVHEKEVRRKIIKAASHLFLEQGFYQTTIRQITQKASISTGTLYHFYQDKEDIFFHIAEETFHKVIQKAEDLVKEENVYLRLACELALHIQAFLSSHNTAELYVIAYGSYNISEEALKKQQIRTESLFSGTNPDFTPEDISIRSLAVKGYLHALALRALNGADIDPGFIIPKSVQLMLQLFNVPEKQIAKTLDSLEKLELRMHSGDLSHSPNHR